MRLLTRCATAARHTLLGEDLKSRLCVLLALLSLTAVFAGSATAAPPVSAWISPAPGDVLSAQIELRVTTSSPATSVEFFAAGVSLGVVSSSSNPSVDTDWRLDLDPLDVPNGALQLSAFATDADGTSTATSEVSVTIDHPDNVSPAIATVWPAAETTVTGTFAFAVTATDDVGVTAASYSLDGTTFLGMQAVGGGAFTADIDSTRLASGPFTFYVLVRDAAGNGSLLPRALTVANPTAPQLVGTVTFAGDVRVGSSITASGASATGYPTPAIGYSWNVCVPGGSCRTYGGATYAPIAADVGRTATLVVSATNGAGDSHTATYLHGIVLAAAGTPVVDHPKVETPVVTAPAETAVVTRRVVDAVAVRPGRSGRTVVTGAGNDRIATGSGDDVIRAGAGNDVISPGRGRDRVYAGAGNDVVYAQYGRSVVECGPGKDVVYANRFTVMRGCETVLVASTKGFSKVRVGANGRPIMPR